MPELESLLAHLLARQFEFVVVGGFAAVAYGVTLLTEDLEVCCPFTPENLRRLEAALSSVHPVHRMVPGRPPFRLAELDLAALNLKSPSAPIRVIRVIRGKNTKHDPDHSRRRRAPELHESRPGL
jgi:hypothetical protein